MTHDQLKKSSQELLGEARITEALDALIACLRLTDRRQDLNDAQLLKINWLNAKQQYELRGTLPRHDYELVQNKTVFGIQTLLDKPEGHFDFSAEVPRKRRRGLAIVLLLVGLAAVGIGIWAALPGSAEKPGTTDTKQLSTTENSTAAITAPDKTIKEPPPLIASKDDAAAIALDQKKEQALQNLQEARSAFNRKDVATAVEKYQSATGYLSPDDQRWLKICKAVVAEGSGTYVVHPISNGQKLSGESVRYFKSPSGRVGDKTDFTDTYFHSLTTKRYLPVATLLKWEYFN